MRCHRRACGATQIGPRSETPRAQGFAHSVLAEPRRRWHCIAILGVDQNRERRSLRSAPRDSFSKPWQYGDKMVNDVVALLDHLELEKAHVVGYSMGGFITMRLLALAPERVLSATVGGAGWRPPGVEDPLMETLAQSLESGQGAGPLIEALNPVGAEPPTQEQIAMANQMILAQNDPKALAAVIRGMANLGVERDTLEKNSVPTLALIGSLDPLKEGVDAMDGVMKELTVQVIDGADHMTALMSPQYSQAMADAIRDFVMKSCNCG
ncbi:MAG: alpha/beta hydrolase [Acidobacteriota bacterium]